MMAGPAQLSPEWLAGKRIVVTGAASGIGLGAAQLFQRLGAELVVADRDHSALIKTWSGLTPDRCQQVDAVDEAACEALMASANALLGGIDGVFISDVVAPAQEVARADWQRLTDINLRGTFHACRAAGRIMLTQGYGSIVTISSVNGLTGMPRRHAYDPAKAAIAQLTRTLACEWAGAGIRVNSLAPTYIRTSMIDRLSAEGKVDVGRLERRTPMGRLGEVEDVGAAAAFLLSDWSRFLTGVLLPIDGGWLAYGGPGDVEPA